MSNLTMRSKIRVYWTTNPGDMGYGGRPTGGEMGAWKRGSGYELCSVRKACRMSHELERMFGVGVSKMISYQHDGFEIDKRELEELVMIADMPARYR